MVRDNKFREDLYYRLNVFPITMPPLRVRIDDIPALVWAFMKEFEKTMAKRFESIPRKSIQALQSYPWPGNIRELQNVVEQAMIICQGKIQHIRIPYFQESIKFLSFGTSLAITLTKNPVLVGWVEPHL